MSEKNIVAKIVEERKADISKLGYTFGHKIPEKRTRPVHPFMNERGVILEVKRASPSKGDIAPNLDSFATAKAYCENGAAAISCLTEERYFKGTLEDLQKVCQSVDEYEKETGKKGPAVLRKDFLISEEEIEIAFLCGADAVLLISGILTLEKMLSMTEKCNALGIKALAEVRTEEDVKKVQEVKKLYEDTLVCGVNSRNLKDFSIDLMVPAMLKKEIGGQVIFESGITTSQAAAKTGAMGFCGILLGEKAAKNPEKAGEFVKAFCGQKENLYGKGLLLLAEKIREHKERTNLPMVKICGLTRSEDVILADKLGAFCTGFIFAKEFKRNVYGKKFDEIRKILPEIHALKAGVITNPESEEAHFCAEMVKQGVLDFVQLHALDDTALPSYLAEIPHFFAASEKVIAPDLVSEAFLKLNLEERVQHFESAGESRILQVCENHHFVKGAHLWAAGGLNPENVKQIIKEYNPELIDVSGGIEDETQGIKNKEKMKEFFKNIGYGENYVIQ